MNHHQLISDKAAIGVSALCVLHCLATPFIISWLPTFIATYLEGEAFHIALVFLIIPLSLYALNIGCKQHKRYQLMALGVSGVALLLIALFFGHDLLGERGEAILTVIGSGLIAIAHVFNFRSCRNNHAYECTHKN